MTSNSTPDKVAFTLSRPRRLAINEILPGQSRPKGWSGRADHFADPADAR
jgi:hypothetical protein